MRKNSWQEQLPLSLVELVPAGVSGAWAKLHGAARPALRRDRNHTTGPWGSGKDKTHQEGEEIFPKIQAEAVCPCPISWEKRKEQIGRFSAPEPTGIQNPWDGQCWPALDTQSSEQPPEQILTLSHKGQGRSSQDVTRSCHLAS